MSVPQLQMPAMFNANNAPQPLTAASKLQSMLQKAHILRQAGHSTETSPEYAQLVKYIQLVQQQQVQLQQHRRPAMPPPPHPDHGFQQQNFTAQPGPHPSSNNLNGSGHPVNGIERHSQPPVPTNGMGSHAQPGPSHSPVPFTEEQVSVLRAQISAFKSLSRGLPLSDDVASAIYPASVKLRAPSETITSETLTTNGSIQHGDRGKSSEPPSGPFLEDITDSGIFPYNSFMHPSSYLKPNANAVLTRRRDLLIPSLMPPGLDPHQILGEYSRYIDNRIQQRITELSSLPSTMGEGFIDTQSSLIENSTEAEPLKHPSLDVAPNTHGKMRAVIELKALGLVNKQRLLRAQVVERLVHGSLVPVDRKDLRRFRKPTVRDVRATENLERKQRQDRERRAKQKHLDYLTVICQHGQVNVLQNRRAHQNKAIGVGRRALAFHTQTEKEEQKRIERISKERLRALKADDEEAYLKLIDTAKDTRITHLLRQTDSYLDSLAQAVQAQQADDALRVPVGDIDETAFGAQRMDDEGEDRPKVDYYSIAHRITEKISAQPTILVGGTLKDYQLKGLQWMVSLYNNRLNGILADEMGLGKTIQSISLVSFLIEVKRQPGPYLVIVPLSTITNWMSEFLKWAPSIPVISYKGSPPVRRQLQNQIRMGGFQVVLTTFEYIIKDRPVLGKIKWLHMIIDEGHRMKNTQSKLAQTLTQYYSTRYRLILTGTPLQNNLPELWALLNFVLPKIFNSVKSFDEWFNTPFANSGASDQMRLTEEESLLVIKRLHKVLRPFLLRRLKKDVESELPDKVEKVVKVRLSGLQTILYRQMKKYKTIAGGLGRDKTLKGLNNELMQLRKICQHPFLFGVVEDTIMPGPNVDESLVRSSGKFEMLAKILPKFFATGHRVLIFFQMTQVMDIMSDFLRSMNCDFLRLDGSTKQEERADYVKWFNAPNSIYKVFILSTRAGGLGLNLQSADTVVIFDSDWNPHADLQAQDRAHRIGQTKAVRILRFITEKSVEEAMFARARFKLGMDEKVIQAGRFDNKSTAEDSEEMLRAILEADNEVEENEESGILNDDEINEIIARSDDEVRIFREMDVERERAADEAWRAKGNRGPRPASLIQVEELPSYWQTEDVYESTQEEDRFEGRGARKRQQVNYSEGLTDEQLAQVLEGEDESEEERPRESKSRRPTNGRSDSKKGKNGRRGEDTDLAWGGGGKRKRAKETSLTPELDDDDDSNTREPKRRKTAKVTLDSATIQKMKKIFQQIYAAVVATTDDTGRKRCELFKDLPDKKDYPDYYVAIKQPISMNQIRKKNSSGGYKSATQFRDDWQLMFRNARTYNQEGSWVYVDAEEMEKVFQEAYNRLVTGSGIPGSEQLNAPTISVTPVRNKASVKLNVRQVVSDDDDDYLSGNSDDE